RVICLHFVLESAAEYYTVTVLLMETFAHQGGMQPCLRIRHSSGEGALPGDLALGRSRCACDVVSDDFRASHSQARSCCLVCWVGVATGDQIFEPLLDRLKFAETVVN